MNTLFMTPNIVLGVESGLTKGALVLPQILVDSNVLLEMCLKKEPFRADVALVRLIFFLPVHTQVMKAQQFL